ncbi:hypothetical protein HYU12_02010 [Candidatus Woesearchaeota archaeon]|nr:hypothetical protein [Candidatus Woesearchaeota archaeon]
MSARHFLKHLAIAQEKMCEAGRRSSSQSIKRELEFSLNRIEDKCISLMQENHSEQLRTILQRIAALRARI